jgi:uncharacterized protein (DUF2252 family)
MEKSMKKKSGEEKKQSFAAPKPGFTREERRSLGKYARQTTPLEAQGKLSLPHKDRDIIQILEKSNRGRLQELIPLRYARMLVSPFTFYRGSASLMAFDLSATPSSGFIVQACGDCHIQNFGVFATPERKLVVDINDFDETLPAPWEWDVKRLATSLVLAATSSGFSAELGEEAARIFAAAYREHMLKLSEMSLMEVWYSHVEAQEIMDASASDTRQRQKKNLKEAIEKSSPEILRDKLTVTTSGKLRFRDMPPLLCHMEGIGAGEMELQAFEEYRKTLPEDRQVLLNKFELIDIARKVVGIGSVGTLCGVLLLASSEEDLLVLQLKEARKSVLEPYAGASRYEHHGQRVVSGQKLMQAASDMFLGWVTGARAPHRHFFVRQLRDVKIGVNTSLWGKEDYAVFPKMAGRILARAHARSGDPSVLRGYIGKSEKFDEAITAYAVAYAKQTERDYNQFLRACKSGTLEVAALD